VVDAVPHVKDAVSMPVDACPRGDVARERAAASGVVPFEDAMRAASDRR